jgi:hypothetical protein
VTDDRPVPRGLILRRFELGDADAASRLIMDDLLRVNSRDDGEAAMAELARFYTPECVTDHARAGEMVVALEGSVVVGTATLQ